MKESHLRCVAFACLNIVSFIGSANETIKETRRRLLTTIKILTACALLLSEPVKASLIGDSVQASISTTRTTSYVVTQFNSPTVVNNTASPEFTGNFHYEFNTTGGPVVYEFDLMLDIGDNYFEFWTQPTNDWGATGSFSASGSIYSVGIADIDASGPIDSVIFDPYYNSPGLDDFGFPLEQWDPTLGTISWNVNTVFFSFYGATDSGEHFRYYFSEGASVVPIPAAIYLFGSGLLGLIGVSRHKKII